MTRLFNAFPLQFFVIVAATIVLYIISPWLAPGSVSGSSILTVLSFASILVIAAAGQTLVIQQGGLDLSVAGVISLAAVLVTKYPAGRFGAHPLGWGGSCQRRCLGHSLRGCDHSL